MGKSHLLSSPLSRKSLIAHILSLDSKTIYGLTECYKALGDEFANTGIFGKDSTESKEVKNTYFPPLLSLSLLTHDDLLSSVQIISLLESIPPFPPTFPTATTLLSSLEQRLTLRTYLVGQSRTCPSLADYALHSALKNNVIALGLLPKAPHTQRWYTYLSQLAPISKALVEVPLQAKVKEEKPKKEKDDKKKEDKANSTFELGLPGAIKGQVVTRLPPEPSGYLHIGHAKVRDLPQTHSLERRVLIPFLSEWEYRQQF